MTQPPEDPSQIKDRKSLPNPTQVTYYLGSCLVRITQFHPKSLKRPRCLMSAHNLVIICNHLEDPPSATPHQISLETVFPHLHDNARLNSPPRSHSGNDELPGTAILTSVENVGMSGSGTGRDSNPLPVLPSVAFSRLPVSSPPQSTLLSQMAAKCGLNVNIYSLSKLLDFIQQKCAQPLPV